MMFLTTYCIVVAVFCNYEFDSVNIIKQNKLKSKRLRLEDEK